MSRWKQFKTIKKYAKGKMRIDLAQGIQEIALFHAGNRSIKVVIKTTLQDDPLSYPPAGKKCWEKSVTLDGPCAPGLIKPVPLSTPICHDYSLCLAKTHHEVGVKSLYLRGAYRSSVQESGHYGFNCR